MLINCRAFISDAQLSNNATITAGVFMTIEHPHLQKGDAVFATTRIANDGSVPHADEGEVFAEAGTVGMLLNMGYIEEDPSQELFLVSFQTSTGELGPPVACLASEISLQPL
jgi:nitrogen fixation protein NifZ